MENRSILPTTSSQRVHSSNPLASSTVMRVASVLAVLSFVIMISLALFLEAAFESSVCVTDMNWVRIPVDRPGEGHFLLPLALFKTSLMDRLVMPVLFAVMIILASALLVQVLELERFFL